MPEYLTGLPPGFVAQQFSNILLFTASLSPALVAANTTAEQTFNVANLPANPAGGGGVLLVTKPTAQAGLGIVGARVVGAGQIGITFSNNTAAGITPTAAETYSFVLLN